MSSTFPSLEDAPTGPLYCASCGKECFPVVRDDGCEPRRHDWQWASDCCKADMLDNDPNDNDEQE